MLRTGVSTARSSRFGGAARGVEAVLAAAMLAAAGLGLYSVNRPLPNADALMTARVPQDAVVVDARGSLAYRQGHLPGARSLWSRSLLSFEGAVPGMLADPDDLAEELRAAGLTPGDRVVVYDDGDGRDAPLVVLVLRAFGLDARLLEGGLEAWRAVGGTPQSGAPAEVAPSDAAFTFDTQLVVSGDEAAAHLAADAIAPVDVRAASAYGAEHVEGAIRLDADALLPGGSLPRFSTLDAQLRQVRLTRDTHPLIYGADVRQAARAWLTLAAYGIPHLHVYRGPFEGLAQSGLPLSQTAATQATSTRSSSVCWR